MNCVENLPVYTAIVVAMLATRVTSPILDGLAITILAARICQSSIHVLMEQTNMIAGIRFAFYFLQAICMIAMGLFIAASASFRRGEIRGNGATTDRARLDGIATAAG